MSALEFEERGKQCGDGAKKMIAGPINVKVF
jgi:hypothetical protein